jgi:hypothetical protein
MLSNRRQLLLAAFVLATSSCRTSKEAEAGQKVIVGRQVPSNQHVSMDKIDHALWDGLLRKYVDAAGRVDYSAWKSASQDVLALDNYLRGLSRADANIRTSREGRLAFWINAYNAVTIRGILREYPTSSIRNHTARLYGYNIWHDLLLVVGQSKISLYDIEHEVLRKSDEPRIHFAIVCASHSCPRLRNEAYTSLKLERQITASTQEFFADPDIFRYVDGTFYLSPILKWYSDDFGHDRGDLLRYIAPYLPDRTAQQAAASGAGRVSYLGYDWGLNDQ